jgi:hypothetical protein
LSTLAVLAPLTAQADSESAQAITESAQAIIDFA